jgi:hypothetical protein
LAVGIKGKEVGLGQALQLAQLLTEGLQGVQEEPAGV